MLQPIEGIRILDLSRVYAAPAGSMILGDLGAEVIRIEHPDGSDSMRDWGPYMNGQSTYYLCANRNKKSILLNLKEKEDTHTFLELVKDADVVLENFKAGDMEKMGLGYELLKSVNPRIIHCAVTGFGQTGALSKEPGFDPVVQAMSGLMSVTGEKGGEPMRVGIPIADILTSLYVAIGILSALRLRDITGKGQHIDLSLLDVQLSSLANVASSYLNAGVISERLGNSHNNVVPYQVFECTDGPLMVCVGTNRQFAQFCHMIDRKEWIEDARFHINTKRKENEAELVGSISEIMKQKTRDEWMKLLRQHKIPAGRVNTIEEALTQQQVQDRDLIGEIEHPQYGRMKFIKNPLQYSELNIEYKRAAPLLGEDTEEILSCLLNKDNKEKYS